MILRKKESQARETSNLKYEKEQEIIFIANGSGRALFVHKAPVLGELQPGLGFGRTICGERVIGQAAPQDPCSGGMCRASLPKAPYLSYGFVFFILLVRKLRLREAARLGAPWEEGGPTAWLLHSCTRLLLRPTAPPRSEGAVAPTLGVLGLCGGPCGDRCGN